jgi:hypothetical protein
MTHLHSDQCNVPVHQHPMVFSPYSHLVNAPVFPLDSHPSALIPPHYPESPIVVDGEVLISSLTTPAHIWDDAGPTIGDESKRSLLQRAIEDPYWILMTLMVAAVLSLTVTVVYGVIQITLSIGHWLHANGATLGAIAALIIALMFCGGASAAKCTGIHCGGCKG